MELKSIKKYETFEELKADKQPVTNYEESIKNHKAFEEFIMLLRANIVTMGGDDGAKTEK
ncbi:hypothetical protein [Mucilaginibacter pedocola]|uniref:Uncharacterized protein n=1 Tax=Mucilaginibacter pedocola TaxID=1792845 RepID=A0A1S9PAM7_9SPHI|nr:hypothetical protein [Mucilaginibacter pedocola]OOQ57979.1 hypothetical protein BC343_09925 [Mucilaginibacter pedocola]